MYAYQSDVYCDDCGDAIKRDLEHVPDDEREDSNDYPQWGPDGAEADAPQHCADCGEFLRNELTDDGRQYVIDAIAREDGVPDILAEWSDYYDIPRELWAYTEHAGDIQYTLADVLSVPRSGPADDAVASLVIEPHIAEQLDAIEPDAIRRELRGYGAWSDEELSDDEQNRHRLVWVTTGNARGEA